MRTQSYTDPLLGDVLYQDRKEAVHSALARPRDIKLITKLPGKLAAEVRRDIAEDIRRAQQSDGR